MLARSWQVVSVSQGDSVYGFCIHLNVGQAGDPGCRELRPVEHLQAEAARGLARTEAFSGAIAFCRYRSVDSHTAFTLRWSSLGSGSTVVSIRGCRSNFYERVFLQSERYGLGQAWRGCTKAWLWALSQTLGRPKVLL
jgi:hypothetical protein